jgi:hypothetical protein
MVGENLGKGYISFYVNWQYVSLLNMTPPYSSSEAGLGNPFVSHSI